MAPSLAVVRMRPMVGVEMLLTGLPNWARWLPSFLVGFCLVSAFSMAAVLKDLAKANRFYRAKDGVLRNHRLMNAFAVGLLVYALCAVWGRWPVPALAVVIAAVINYVHYGGYKAALIRG